MAFNVSASAWESDVNINDNTSIAHLRVTITTTGESHSNYDHYGTIVIDGASYSHGPYRLPYTTTKTFESTKVITHNNDGTKTINWSYSFPVKTDDTRTGSGTLALTTIPRASQPSVSKTSEYLGTQVTINTNRVSNTFTHTITYAIGSLTNQTTGLGASTGVGLSTTFTPPLTLANQFPNSTIGNLTITCKTYNGTTLIGTKTCTMQVKTQSNQYFIPSMTLTPTAIANTQFNNKYLNKVSGVTIKATFPSGSFKYGASLSSYSITGPTKSSSNADLVANPININMTSASQQLNITGSVTDTRGYVGSGSTQITLYRYNVPQITNFTLQRCLQDGRIDINGTYALANITYTYQNDGYSNSMATKKVNINYTDYTLTTTETTANGVVTGTGTTIIGGSLNINNHYDYVVTCTDAVGKTATTNGTLPTSSRIINVRPRWFRNKFWKICRTRQFSR